MIPVKLLILGVFVVGVTVGVVVGGAGGGTGGCDALNSVVESASDDSEDAAADAGDNSSDAPGTDDSGDAGDGSTDDGGSGDGGAGGGTDDGGTDDGGSGDGGSAGNGNDNGGGSGAGNSNSNSNSNDNGGSNSNANDNGGDNGPPPIAGAFSGTMIRATVSQSTGGDPRPMPDRSMSFALDFGDDRVPEDLPIINFSGAPNVVTVALQTADPEETITTQNGQEPITLRVRATDVDYSASGFRVVHAINYESVNGNLTRRGTGTQTIEASLDANGNLSFDAQVDYTIRFIVNNSTLVTATESIHAIGTLTRQP